MRATFTDEQETLADTARDLAEGGREAARALLEGGSTPDQPTASLFSGFAGLAVPEDVGGMGGDLVDLAIVLERLGRQVTPTAWVSHVLAVQTALGAGLDVSGAADGSTRWALAVEESGQEWGAWQTSLEDGRLSGTKDDVRDGAEADAAVVVTADGTVALAAPGERTSRDPVDATRPLASLSFDGEPDATGEGGTDVLQRATTALAAELAGVGRGALDLAVGFAKQREQFGQPVGRFQGVAHQLAEAWTGVELAWSLALYAAWAVGADDPDATRAVHAAKSKAGEAAIHAAERGTQVHGGIGITWEADPHLYLRRALASDAWLGSTRVHRRLLSNHLEA